MNISTMETYAEDYTSYVIYCYSHVDDIHGNNCIVKWAYVFDILFCQLAAFRI